MLSLSDACESFIQENSNNFVLYCQHMVNDTNLEVTKSYAITLIPTQQLL